jgi:hypothetical protein
MRAVIGCERSDTDAVSSVVLRIYCRSHFAGHGPFSGHKSPPSSNVWSWDHAPLPDFNFASPPIQPASNIEPSLHQPICSWGQLKLGADCKAGRLGDATGNEASAAV